MAVPGTDAPAAAEDPCASTAGQACRRRHLGLGANGFCGHALQQSPTVGRVLAELVAHGAYRPLDLSEFGWQRVLQGRPLELNVA